MKELLETLDRLIDKIFDYKPVKKRKKKSEKNNIVLGNRMKKGEERNDCG